MGRWRVANINGKGKRSDIPAGPGVYVFIRDGRVVYVGQSVSLRARLTNYRPTYLGPPNYGEAAIGWKYHPIQRGCVLKISESKRWGDWLMRELRLIRRLKPEHNSYGY